MIVFITPEASNTDRKNGRDEWITSEQGTAERCKW